MGDFELVRGGSLTLEGILANLRNKVQPLMSQHHYRIPKKLSRQIFNTFIEFEIIFANGLACVGGMHEVMKLFLLFI